MKPDYDPQGLIPHAPPFRLIDRVLEADVEAGRLLGVLRVSADDPWAAGGELPATFLIEALCQAAACLNGLEGAQRGGAGHQGYLAAASDFEFPAAARPGDELLLEVTRTGALGRMVAFSAEARIATGPCARGRLLFAVSFA